MSKWRNSASILFPEFIPLILGSLIYHIYRAIYIVRPATGGLWWTKGRSAFFMGDGTIKKKAIMVVFVRAFTSTFVPVNIALVTYFSREVGFSPAVI